MLREYITVSKIAGPLILVERVENVKYGELCLIEFGKKEIRRGRVLEVSKEAALVQIFEGTGGIDVQKSKVKFLGKGIELGVALDMLGRVFDGIGRPKDGGPAILPEENLDINGDPINPDARDYPSEFIQTGISAIDGMNPLVRGQKLPIFSGSGLAHSRIAAQIARQAKVLGEEEPAPGESAEAKERVHGFAVVFGAMGITFEEANFFILDFKRTAAIERAVLFVNLADDPAIERIATPRMAMTAAEYLAFKKDMHVAVILIDMSNYCESLRQVAAARKEIPGRRGYPGYLYTDLATIYERAGRIKGKKGSITLMPVLTMPEDDKTHPIPDLTGYITEGQLLTSRALSRRGIYPPIDVLPSLSRLKDKGIGKGKTREDHADVLNQIFAAYARGKEAKELAVILGEAALTDMDKLYVKFSDEFEERFVRQGDHEDRTIQQTLDIGWELLSMLPAAELKRIRPEYIEKYYKKPAIN